jgi:DNA repair protein RadD
VILRPYQQSAIDATYAYLRDGKGTAPIVAACVGAGKSILMARMILDMLAADPGARILSMTHLSELIAQNAAELGRLAPELDIGIYSAGLRSRDRHHNVLFAGIQSIEKRIHQFDPFDLVLIDEAHLVPKNSNTRYRRALDTLRMMNPRTVIVGMSGTPYRLDGGWLHKGEGAIFDGIAYEISISDLVEAGYLVTPTARRAEASSDITGVHRRGGEFVASEMAERFNTDETVDAAVEELIRAGRDRKAWLVFAASIEHGEHVTAALRARGIDAALLTGQTAERDTLTDRFRRGDLRCLVNINVLTAGYNAPACDLVSIMRSTASTALFVQMCGRGLRLHPGKEDCLILDFGGNFERHGLLDQITPRQPGGGSGEGEAPAKPCPQCHTIVHLSARECPDCGYEFPGAGPRHASTAYSGAALSSQIEPVWCDVDGVTYSRHKKAGKPDSVRVTYRCGLRMISEWWCPEHEGYARRKTAQHWARMGLELPGTVGEVLDMADDIPKPGRVLVKPEGKYERVIRWEFEEAMSAA